MQDVNFPSNESQLYGALHTISRIRGSPTMAVPHMHVHSPSRLELAKLARDHAMHCNVGMNAGRCANSALEHAYYRAVDSRDVAFIEPAHADMPSHIHSPHLVQAVDPSLYNRQVSRRALQDGFKHTFPQSASFFDMPWNVRLPACANVDCKPNVMTPARQVHRDCRGGAK